MIEAQVNYIIKLIKGAGLDARALVAPKTEAARAYDQRLQGDLQGRVWAARCGAWYVDENGRNYTLYPQDVRTFLRDMESPDMSEYDLVRTGAGAV